MAALKRKVLDAARKAVVLNADDPRCLALASEFSSLRRFLFSHDATSPALGDYRNEGCDVLFLDGTCGTVVWASRSNAVELIKAAEIPIIASDLSLTSNAMAAAGLALGLGIDIDAIRSGLCRYTKEFAQRLNPINELSRAQA
jgi:cyanophycin synthetase